MEDTYKNFIELFNIQYKKIEGNDFNFSAYIVLIQLLDKVIELGKRLGADTKFYIEKKDELIKECQKYGYSFKE